VAPDRIEREVLIEAPVDVVWEIVTEPAQISRWFSDSVELELRPGGEGALIFDGRGAAAPRTVRLQVEKVDPPHYFSWRWAHPDGVEPDESNSLLVEFSLSAEGTSTRLRLVESGFRRLEQSEEDRERYIDEHNHGWDTHLSRLRVYAAGGRRVPAGG
jgi:uncharacterized protein YndB with AHSA1/START domain